MPIQVIKPGRSLIEGAGALESPKRAAGKWPYQWLFPGPNSRQVLANGQTAIPPLNTSAPVVNYTVPDGMVFSLRAIVFAFFGTGWNEGTVTGLFFTLNVLGAGTRAVDFLQNVATHLGSTDQPYPILGRLEFNPLDQLQVSVLNPAGGVVTPGTPNIAVAHLVGHIYPSGERVG